MTDHGPLNEADWKPIVPPVKFPLHVYNGGHVSDVAPTGVSEVKLANAPVNPLQEFWNVAGFVVQSVTCLGINSVPNGPG